MIKGCIGIIRNLNQSNKINVKLKKIKPKNSLILFKTKLKLINNSETIKYN
jgi:hypothetical protein